ncbi:MAG: Protein kinase, partial [Myxococcaceae bacterium]|nr:Protein kinase [Myxococcaceae bacterium]
PKLLDFGIAKIGLAELDKSALTRSGQVIGTPLYMSLEQFRAEKDIDARTDVYALGVVLYQALTGRTPFEASTLPHLIVKLTSTVPPSPRSLRPELPEELSALVMHAIARERTDRVPSIESLIRGLDPFGPRERDSGGAWPAHPRESWTVQPTQAAQSSEAHALSPRRRTGVVALGSLIAAATAALLFLPRALPPATITRPPATARPEPAPKSNHTAETAAIDIGSVWARPAPAELSDRDASVLPDSSAASPTDAGAAGSNVSVSKLRHKVVRKERPPGPSPAPTPGLETQPVVQAIASDAKRSDDARERDEQPKLRIRLPTSPEF